MKKEEITTLVQKIRNKDNNAIGELYELVYRDIYFTAYKVLKNKEDAEDIVHDSFIICMKKIDTLKDDIFNIYQSDCNEQKSESFTRFKI